MRVFWIIVCVLATAAAVIAFRSSGGSKPADVVAAASVSSQTAASGAGTISPAAAAPPPGQQLPMPQAPPLAASNTRAETLVADLMDSSAEDSDDGIDDALADDATPTSSSAAGFDPHKPIDGKYIVAGAGTKDDPFQITWDLLLLAAQTYVPRESRTDIPPQVMAIDGKNIRISGYFAFPLASTDAREVLFMLNQWDGCCIGVPPTPYDAIEVRLRDASDGRKQYMSYGTLSGVIRVDPFVQDGWLLGMYVMQDGVIDADM